MSKITQLYTFDNFPMLLRLKGFPGDFDDDYFCKSVANHNVVPTSI